MKIAVLLCIATLAIASGCISQTIPPSSKEVVFAYNNQNRTVYDIDLPLDVNEACKVVTDVILKDYGWGNYTYSCRADSPSKTGDVWSVLYACDNCPFPSGGTIYINESSREVTLGPAIV